MSLGDYLQTADWKKEKHAPVIDSPEKVKSGEEFSVALTIGKEIPPPQHNRTSYCLDRIIFQTGRGKIPQFGWSV